MAMNRLSMHSTALSIFIASTFAIPATAQAQQTGSVEFHTTTETVEGTVRTCTVLLGCTTQNISPANPVSVGANGTADNVANNVNVQTTNGVQVATIAISDNGASDADSAGNDSSVATEYAQSVNFLGDAITFDEVQASADCIAASQNNNVIPVTCTPQATITNLKINGQRVFPSGTQVAPGTQVTLTNITAVLDGLAYKLNGTLFIGATNTIGSGTADAASTFAPVSFVATMCLLTDLTCALQTTDVSIQDDVVQKEYSYITSQKMAIVWEKEFIYIE